MTQLEAARKGLVTEQMIEVAQDEGLSPEEVCEVVASGEAVIPRNIHHNFRAIGIGKGLRTKVNANLGASNFHQLLEEEIEKLYAAIRYGADSVMDLSTGTDLDKIRTEMLSRAPVMLGTVPIYQVASEASIMDLSADFFLDVIERQARQGVDYMTLHCGVTRESVRRLRGHERIEGIVSRGGALLAAWIERTGNENPLFEHFDKVCEILREHDVTISLGDGLRPGATGDATDRGQIAELLVLGELTQRARQLGVQVMIEGPLEKRICGGAPFYVLGPLTCDVAPGYDHITGAIGGAIASAAGTDFLCYVTPAEHLRLPDVDDVREGVIATRIAAHSGDLVKGVRAAKVWNDQMSRFRKALNWEGMYAMAMDPDKARRYKEESEAAGSNVCTMCGSLCSINVDNASIKFVRKQAAAAEQAHAAS
jgi:phosphomethylpyrimidine synthase